LPNVARAAEWLPKLPGDWSQPAGDEAATRELLALLREGETDAACQRALALLAAGTARSGAVWDAAHLAAGELMMRQPGIYGIHTVTSINGLHYAFRASGQPETRLLLLLQGLGWMSQFRNFMGDQKAGLKELRITDLPAADVAENPGEAAEEIFATIKADPAAAAAKAAAFARRAPSLDEFGQGARQLVFTKGTDAHDYKYAMAILEDYNQVSPRWRPEMLATAVYHLPGTTTPDSPLMQRALEAIRGVS
jgi:hypothetical protein